MSENISIAFILCTIAGLSTVLGAFIVFISKSDNKKIITFALGFSSSVMITISFTDLFPNALNSLLKYYNKSYSTIYSLLFIVSGFFIALLIDKLIPENNPLYNNKNTNLYKLGLFSTIAIMVHNFPEGMATFISSYENPSLGLYITLAIMLHNIPEGISIAVPIYASTKSKLKAFKYTFISGIAEPLGAIITFLFLKPFINELMLGIVFAVVCGIMIYITFNELIPNAINTGFKNLYLFSILLGIIVMSLSHIFIH